MTRTILPPSSTAFERAVDFSIAERIDRIALPLSVIADPDTCPDSFLPWLAWGRRVKIWNPEWPSAVKRRVIAAAPALHRINGTPGAIETGLAAMDFEARVIEWFEGDFERGRFRVDVDLLNRGLNEDEMETIATAIEVYKNIRSHLDVLTVRLASRAEAPVIGMTCVMGAVNTVYPLKATPPDSKAPLIVAMGVQSVMTATVYPGEAA